MLTFSASGAVGLMVFSGLWGTRDLQCSETAISSGFNLAVGEAPHPPPLAAPPSRRCCLESPLLSQAEGAKESITSWKGTMLTRRSYAVSACILFQQI